mmetsp:Transcript_58797/g.174945  ORF Transcript_58797/g.174945 Transcript_58797/m.174945 type:complete len:293 (-) Transcript_58797:1201-2079(-)
MEHPGGVACWEHYLNAGFIEGIDKVVLPAPATSKEEIVDLFHRVLEGNESKYSVVSVSHVLTTTGLVLPLPEIAQLAHDSGCLLIVDGAQAAGAIHLNISEIGADAYTISGHKGLLGPTGSGLLYVRSEARRFIRPAILDRGCGAYTQSSGTVPFHTVMGLGYSLRFTQLVGGLTAVAEHGQSLAAITWSGFDELANDFPGTVVLSPSPSSGLASSIISLSLPSGLCVNSVISRLSDDTGHLVVKKLPDYEGGTKYVKNALRISYHMYNNERDAHRTVELLRRAMQQELGGK